MADEEQWEPPPPPEEDHVFSFGTREYHAEEIRLRARNAFMFGVLSLMCCGPIFGVLGYLAGNDAVSLIDTYQVEQEKRGLAHAGRVLSMIGLLLWIGTFVLMIAFWPAEFGR
jgi:hypothetical protein